jgi:hypothetical protein
MVSALIPGGTWLDELRRLYRWARSTAGRPQTERPVTEKRSICSLLASGPAHVLESGKEIHIRGRGLPVVGEMIP